MPRDGFRENPAPFGVSPRRALELGCDGVVSSGLEARALRDAFGERLVVVVPGVRPVDNTVNVAQAFENGADYIVVGRPIRAALRRGAGETPPALLAETPWCGSASLRAAASRGASPRRASPGRW